MNSEKRKLINSKISKTMTGQPRSSQFIWTEERKLKRALSIRRNMHVQAHTLPWDELSRQQRRYILEVEQQAQCDICSIQPFWNGQDLVFHLDHIDGNRSNNVRSNLRLICPNCHSQTPTYGAKNLSVDGRNRLAQIADITNFHK